MTDINCSQCGEPWDVWGLKHESIGYLPAEDLSHLAPLGTADAALDYIARALGSDLARDLRVTLTGITSTRVGTTGQTATVAELAAWWSEEATLGSNESEAAQQLVQHAIFAAVAMGKGCPSCGFDHTDTGPHRDTTLRQLLDGVDDTDPAIYLLQNERW